ncbi:hypothetical protein FO519_009246 [Halicephalobus sp. NKZ332]|nr:hypothetical protein FO519_009246 [Halicephalobus sp. NKZ332]
MIGAATARLRLQKQREPKSKQNQRKSQSPGTQNFRRRSQSPGTRNQPNSLLVLPKTDFRRGSYNALLTAAGPEPKSLKPPSPFPQRKRSGSVPVIKFTLAVAWNIKPDYVRALKVTWARLCDTPRSNCKGIVAIMEKVFEKFESKEKQLKEVFYNSAFVDSMCEINICKAERRKSGNQNIATLRDHIHFFVSLISQVIHSLDLMPQDIFEHIDKIGCYHAQLKKYGFRFQMFDKLGECLIDALVVQDCVRGFPEACKAWTVLVAALIDRLRSAPKHLRALPITGKILTRPDPLPSPFDFRRFSPTQG